MSIDPERMRIALAYIASPTMGLPAEVDAQQFALDGATEEAARRALHTCIGMARDALDTPPAIGLRSVPLDLLNILRENVRSIGCEHWPVEGNLCVCEWLDRVIDG